MALVNWNDKAYGEKMTLSTVRVHEGVKSLEIIRVLNKEVVKILDISETDLPKNANVTFWMYMETDYSEVGIFFRYQDLDNYYVADFKQASYTFFYLGKKEAGSLTWSSSKSLGNLKDIWTHFKLMFCEVGGSVHLMLYKEVAEAWVFVHEHTMSPPKWTDGGAIGVGARDNIGLGGTHKSYIDLTKVYY